jgi:hypothetical protein
MRCLPTEVRAAAWQNGDVAAVIACDSTCCSDASIGDAGCQTHGQGAARIATAYSAVFLAGSHGELPRRLACPDPGSTKRCGEVGKKH